MDELSKIKQFLKKHQTETLIVATVGTIYISTIMASAAASGRVATKIAVALAVKEVAAHPIVVDVNPEQVAEVILAAMKKAPKFNV